MTTPEYFVYDGDIGEGIAPRIASADDLGGSAKENDIEYPPDPVTMPDARDHNQIARVVAAHSTVTPSVVLDVRFGSGDPYIYGVHAKGTTVDADTFTLEDLGDGDTTITWDAGTLPAVTVRPHGLTITDNVAIDRLRCYPTSSHSVRVYTALGASGTDADFTIEIHGETW